MTGEVRVEYFAAARELCGCASEAVALDRSTTTVRGLLALLGARHARLRPLLHRMRLAVNGEIVGDDQPIAAGDEVAVLPPVAGGSERAPMLCALRETPLSVDEVLSAVQRPEAGAIALFIGTVRNHADSGVAPALRGGADGGIAPALRGGATFGQPIARLDYEAHAVLAQRELRAVLDELSAEQPLVRLAALHRTGQLGVGDLAVVVAASAPHRAEAFAACSQAIERIKARVPIWKKEWAADGTAHWVNLEG